MSYGVHAYRVRYDQLPTNTESMDGYQLEKALNGAFLSNTHWSAMRMSWFDQVDQALRTAGFEGTLSSYFMRGAPVPIVPADDFPMVGQIPPDEAPPLLASLRNAVVSMQGDEYTSVVEVLSWLDGLRAHEGVVTFYY